MRAWLIFALLFMSSTAQSAWTSLGHYLALGSTTASDPVVWTTTTTLEVGNVAVCIVAADNDGDGTDTNDFVSVTDSAGHTWTSLGENEVDNGAAAAGAVVGIFYVKATSELASGGTITVDLGASRTSNAITCQEFSVSGGASITSVGTEQKEDAAGSTDVGSLALGSLVDREHLWIRGIGAELSNAVMTPTASFTVFTSTAGITGSPATSMGVSGEYIIASGTTSTSDPTMSDTNSRDRASSMVAIDEDGSAVLAAPYRRLIVAE